MKTKILPLLFCLITEISFSQTQNYSAVRSFGDCGSKMGGVQTITQNLGVNNMFVLPDSSIIVTGTASANPEGHITAVKFKPNGQVDSSFGTNGILFQAFNWRDLVYSSAIRSDGKIYFAGTESPSTASSEARAFIARFKPNGSIDSTFGDNGRVFEANSTDGVSSSDYDAIAIQPDGKVVAIGNQSPNINGGGYAIISRRYLEDGTMDPTFNPGIAYPVLNANSIYGNAFIVDSGKIVYFYGNYFELYIMKLDSTGALDASYSSNGQSTGFLLSNFGRVRKIAGGYIGAGTVNISNIDNRTFKFNDALGLDNSYGTGGIKDIDISGNGTSADYGYDIFEEGNGKYYVVGAVDNPLYLYRLLPNGSIDMSFEGTGYKNLSATIGWFWPAAGQMVSPTRMVLGFGLDLAPDFCVGELDLNSNLLSIENLNSNCASTQLGAVGFNVQNTCHDYQWYQDNSSISGATDGLFTATLTGDYFLTDSWNGETDTSNIISVTVGGTESTITDASCGPYTLNGQTYTSTGTFTQTLTNAAGCDSTINIDITIDTIDNTVTQTGNTLSANGTGTYQWVNCDNNFSAIAGATNQSFSSTGNFAVIITNGSCVDTSDCFTIDGIEPNNSATDFTVTPNPSNGIFNFKSSENISSLSIYDLSGRLIKKIDMKNKTEVQIDLSEYEVSMFLLKAENNYETKFFRLINQ